jgi:hypothetical protein
MNMNLGLKIFSAAACLAVWGCMSVSEGDSAESAANQNRVKFIQETSAGLAKATATSNLPDISSLGCPKLEKLFEDIEDFQISEDEILPKSFMDHLSCFGISGDPVADDFDTVWEKLQSPTELLDCICGGPALSGALGLQGWVAFSAAASAAAGTAFDASKSSAAGSAFDASSSSAAGSAFDGSKSGAAGGGFSAK